MKWTFLLVGAFLASSTSAQPVASPALYGELGGPSALSVGIEMPVAQVGTSSVFVRGGVGFVPRVFEGGSIGTVPLALGLAVPAGDQFAMEALVGGVVTFGDAEASPFLLHGGLGMRLGLGRAFVRGGAAVLVDPSPDPGDSRYGVLPSLGIGVRL